MIVYEQRLNQDIGWALQEGSMHFEKASAIHKTLLKITRRLADMGIPYALAGGMALFFHGYRRFTEDVDILVRREGLQEIHAIAPRRPSGVNAGGSAMKSDVSPPPLLLRSLLLRTTSRMRSLSNRYGPSLRSYVPAARLSSWLPPISVFSMPPRPKD